MENTRTPLSEKLYENKTTFENAFSGCFDFILRTVTVCKREALLICLDGMCSDTKTALSVLIPLQNAEREKNNEALKELLTHTCFAGTDVKLLSTVEEVTAAVLNGNLILLPQGMSEGFCYSVQGFEKKSIQEPQSEQNERGSQEGFTDNIKDNVTLLRRRLKTPLLKTEQTVIGKLSNTQTVLCYLSDRTDPELLEGVKKRLKSIRLDTLLGSGYLRPFLTDRIPHVFSEVGFTERPDMLAGKLSEGKVGIFVDGTPFALTLPYLFDDYFHSMDDYLFSPAYSLFIRCLRLLCFFVAVTLPGFFVAVCTMHPEVLPADVLRDITKAEAGTPLSVWAEAAVIHIIYEIVREAGLRMPRAVGHAVSIVGALVIGDTAVTAGLIGAPMLIVLALTAVCSSVVSKLHESASVLRLCFIVAGAAAGLFGVYLLLGVLLADACAVSVYNIPFSAPFSPFSKNHQADALLRLSWRKLGTKKIQMNGLKKG